jgi:hypothetical protein
MEALAVYGVKDTNFESNSQLKNSCRFFKNFAVSKYLPYLYKKNNMLYKNVIGNPKYKFQVSFCTICKYFWGGGSNIQNYQQTIKLL